MMKRALPAVIAFLALSLAAQNTVRAQQFGDETITREQLQIAGTFDTVPALSLYRPDIFSSVDGSVLIHGLPVLTLLDGRRFPISGALGQMGMTPLDLFPLAFLNAVEVQKVGASPMHGTDAPGGEVNLRLNRNYSGGEMGVFYGKSGGKYGREDFQAYIIGSVGNDKVQITAGAAYEESSGRIPRRGR
jgi:outer membrane receptor protein involved in Fe transport